MDRSQQAKIALLVLLLAAALPAAQGFAPVIVRPSSPGDQSFDFVVEVSSSGEATVYPGSAPDARYEMVVSQRALENVLYSTSPGDALVVALKNGDIKLDGTDAATGVEVSALKGVLPDKSVEKKPGDTVEFAGCSVQVGTTAKGVPAIPLPGTSSLVILNKYSRPSGYSSALIQAKAAYRPEQVSLTGGVYSVPPSIHNLGPSLAPVQNLKSTAPSGANFFVDLFNAGRANGGFLHGTNAYIGPPPGVAPPTTAAMYRAPGAYYGPPPGAYTGLYPVRRPGK